MLGLHRQLVSSVAGVAMVALAGCASQSGASGAGAFVASKEPALAVAAGRYADAFYAATDALRRAGFTLDRIDARAGVITTFPASSAGLATPWSQLDASFADRFRRMLRYERLLAQVRFEPADETEGSSWDVSRFDAGATMQVRVDVQPVPRVGLRVSPLSPRLASVVRTEKAVGASDPQRGANGLIGQAETDDALARALAEQVASALRANGE